MGLPVSQHAGGAPTSNIAFYYDFASPESYLALERLAKSMAALGPELIPIRESELEPLPMPDPEARQRHLEQRVTQLDGILPIIWPEDFPFLDTTDAITVATYAKSIGKVAVFSLSLFRQIYAGGRDPADRTTLYLAAAASEIHPRAVDQALSRTRPATDADTATESARAAGVQTLPTLRLGQRLIVGPELDEDAATVLRLAIEAFDEA